MSMVVMRSSFCRNRSRRGRLGCEFVEHMQVPAEVDLYVLITIDAICPALIIPPVLDRILCNYAS